MAFPMHRKRHRELNKFRKEINISQMNEQDQTTARELVK